ncbi:MAG: hypothetical protein KY468_15390 [Armatimonadetes bacterium]|nr:hypothetical protein [Armatimonadota bacterium]
MFDPAWLLSPALLYPLWEAAHPRLREYTLRFERLPPAWDGLTLLYLSDSHTLRRGRRERNLTRLLTGRETDLLFLGGDIATTEAGYRIILEAARGVTVRLGRYASWGNSENQKIVHRERLQELLRAEGFTMLLNTRDVLEREGVPLALCGVDCPYSEKADFHAALDGLTEDVFRILLMHAPEGLLQMGRHHADLILSGHTHGGQIRMPGLPAFSLHTDTEVDLDRGVFEGDALRRFDPECPETTRLVIGSGLGTSTAPVRLFCPPEAVMVTLRR